jgi:hypothetical protein
MKLRMTALHHTHKGITYRVGETFTGSQRLLDAFGDRMEKAYNTKAKDQEPINVLDAPVVPETEATQAPDAGQADLGPEEPETAKADPVEAAPAKTVVKKKAV